MKSTPPFPAPGEAIAYGRSKELARHQDAAVRRQLAARPDVRPEVLYYLAEDTTAEVRRAIAANLATPRQADLLLAHDHDEEVRVDLARKIARLVPELDAEEREAVHEATVAVIEVLARDQAVRVRRTVAEALKDRTGAPPQVIQTLARDIELSVAAPVLQFSPLLSDDDLLAIIASAPVQGALAVIAKRRQVAERVSDAIVTAAIDRPEEQIAITALLENPSAQIREETLDRILDHAPATRQWHAPLVRRPRLSLGAVRRLAQFVARTLLDQLQQRSDLDPAAAREVAEVVRRRLTEEEEEDDDESEADGPDRPLEGTIAAGDRRGTVRGLAQATGFTELQVEKFIDSHSAKGVVALAWKAKLPMRQAVQLQLRIGGISPRSTLNPRGGTDYPMSEEEMNWQIEFFTGLG
jgi:uncharacterized protein (DUF2336 family)